MSNPFLNDKALKDASQAGWAAPDPASVNTYPGTAPGTGRGTPFDDGPVSPWAGRVMTVGGTITATGVLLAILLVAASFGWAMAPEYEDGTTGVPGLAIVAILIGFVCAIAVHFKPLLARILGPIYAVAMGLFVGAISAAYESLYDGIVYQAIGATLAVFAVMLLLYRTQIIRVTDRFRKVVVTATLGIAVFYGISLLMSLFGATPPFIHSPSLVGIGFSVLVAGLAALNLTLDFDFIEKGAAARLPKGMEWYAAFGLVITLVWLYLELLRLLSKLNQR